MSLLRKREIARRRLETCTKSLLTIYDSEGRRKTKKIIKMNRQRAIDARDALYKIDRELCYINHAITPRLEMLAKVWLILQPEHKDEVAKLFDFT